MINIFVVCLGLVFGSFIAAYSYRYPRGIKISKGTSFCDKCKRKISWYENIPVFSYLFLGGKCKTCKKAISLRYPIIELSTSIVFVLILQGQTLQGGAWNFIYIFSLLLILEIIFIIDFEHQIIPDDFVFAGLFLALLINHKSLFINLFSGFLAATFLLSIYLITHGRGMGLGDVKFAVLGGMIVGINNLFVWMFSAFLTGAIIGIILILLGNAKLKSKIAFGPFLIIAIPIAFTVGNRFYEVFF